MRSGLSHAERGNWSCSSPSYRGRREWSERRVHGRRILDAVREKGDVWHPEPVGPLRYAKNPTEERTMRTTLGFLLLIPLVVVQSAAGQIGRVHAPSQVCGPPIKKKTASS